MAQPTYEWHPPEQGWRERDLLDLPADGNRYEIIDGSLHVTPPAGSGTVGPDDPVQVTEPWPMTLDPSAWPR
ncbi:hypothetical protein O7606_26225 [Micromonospora sp. WMMD882]|uniref:hypothetical protein n=1 Tax=Micromonospora sp. WMMD882 TaxID=3015151 RepID=UPI00248CDCD7|nr:hypothetical protein [Micromonospora sp. WMMD882]WBB79599.1 hypothetical protein O7606_26225 [Micromonospora sp. WMMD882]